MVPRFPRFPHMIFVNVKTKVAKFLKKSPNNTKNKGFIFFIELIIFKKKFIYGESGESGV